MKSKGFTLIELLVVIAIIGILASVVLASLNTARDKGADAAIRASVASARSQAELFYDDNGLTYVGVCTAGTNNIGPMILSAAQKFSATPPSANAFVYASEPAVCHDSATEWATIVSLKKPVVANSGWCADSGGASREAISLGAGVTRCP